MDDDLEPELKPLIDVTFQLLIFFMVTINFKTQEGNLNSFLPKDRGLQNNPVDKPQLDEFRLELRYKKDQKETKVEIGNTKNEFYWPDEKKLTEEDRRSLGEAAKSVYKKVKNQAGDDTPPVKLDPTPEVPSGRVITALDVMTKHILKPYGAKLQYSANTLSGLGQSGEE